MKKFLGLSVFLLLFFGGGLIQAQTPRKSSVESRQVKQTDAIGFPDGQPGDANVNKPYPDAVLSVSPPGFCWWRAAKAGEVSYKLFVYDAAGKEFFVSEALQDCAYVPGKVFPAGKYSWVVRAYDKSGKKVAERNRDRFTICEQAYALPKPDCKSLVAKVPAVHPRLIFTKGELPLLRKDLAGVNREQYDLIAAKAEKGLETPLCPTPTFDRVDEGARNGFAQKRTDYRVDYHRFGDVYLDAVEPLSFMYMVTGEEKYGEAAKRHLLRLTELPIGGNGPLVINDSKFDEVTLQIADALPRAYDWAYDAFSQRERVRMEQWMVALGDSLCTRMSAAKRDFFYYSGESHDGRIPPYLMNFAVCLANHPENAARWLDFALTASLSVYPQWASDDGGWAEGVDYALTYSGRFIPPLEALYRMTGFNLWERPFYKNFPYFLTYCLSPIGEVSPFGDSEDKGVEGSKSAVIHSMLRFYAERNQDPEMKWWTDMFRYDKENVDRSMKGLVQDIMLKNKITPRKPQNIKQERVFRGVGWAAIHSDITAPEQDLFLLFKSSPFGPESHSHLDQNSFVIMKGGKALAIPAGSRYPQHGSPFHTKYTRQSLAHNTILFNGEGQVDKDPRFNARIFADDATAHISYVAGEAGTAYQSVKRFDRHMVMLRPSVILLLDDLELGGPGTIEWLLHGKEKFELDQAAQSLISNRDGESMKVQFMASKPFAFSQDDRWPLEPKTGYPMVTTPDPVDQWHFTARTDGVDRYRVAAVMTVGTDAQTRIDRDRVSIRFTDGGKADVKINTGAGPQLMEITYIPVRGTKETMTINQKQ